MPDESLITEVGEALRKTRADYTDASSAFEWACEHKKGLRLRLALQTQRDVLQLEAQKLNSELARLIQK